MEPGTSILVVEDDPQNARLLELLLSGEGFRVHAVGRGSDALAALERERPDLALLDLMLPDMDGIALLRRMHEHGFDAPTIFLTASPSVESAVEAMKLGVFDYLMKPVDREVLLLTVRNALRLVGQEREINRLRSALSETYGLESVIYRSEAMARVVALARKVLDSTQTVLIHGESGAGKEIIARALHFSGPRRNGPFVAVNCAALPESLLESELFGHEKGAFTGALRARAGVFEQAHTGTLLLDEIGDMPLPMQAKLLRVLEDRHIVRVGGQDRIPVDVRVVCATNRSLGKGVREGKFREDLYYRIQAFLIELPPLRERPADILPLAEHLLRRHNQREGKAIRGFAAAAIDRLLSYSWPGNVRELENVIGRSVVLCEGDEIDGDDLQLVAPGETPRPVAPDRSPLPTSSLPEAVEGLERRMILEALDRNEWVKARAARTLGLTERVLSYKMSQYGIARAGAH